MCTGVMCLDDILPVNNIDTYKSSVMKYLGQKFNKIYNGMCCIFAYMAAIL